MKLIFTSVAVILVCLTSSAMAEQVAEIDARAVVGGIDADPHDGTAVLTATAFTQPAGATVVRSREVALIVGVTHGVSDRLEVSADATILPVVNGALGAKLRVYDRGRLHGAITANVGFVQLRDDEGEASAALAGAVVSYCTDAACDSLVSASVTGGAYAISAEGRESGTPVIAAMSWIQRVHPRVKLVAEVVGAVNDVSRDDEVVTLTGAVRYHTPRFALDVGMIHALDWDEEGVHHVDGPGPLGEAGLPWVAFSVRWP